MSVELNTELKSKMIAAERAHLRDEFAKAAMQAELTGYDGSNWKRVARQAYEMADAMLEAREE